jgi:hypothetical protein
MKTIKLYIGGLLAVVLVMFSGSGAAAQDSVAEKISPSLKLSYKIIDGKKSVKVEVTKKEGKKYIPIEKIIVNLYNGEVKKYDPVTAGGWVGNFVTDEDGICNFVLSEKFNKLTQGVHSFTFIASIGSYPEYEDTQEQIVMNDVSIRLSSKRDSLTTVTAQLNTLGDSIEKPLPETEMKLFVKRTFGMLPFGEENLTTDENGEVSGVIPADLPGNPDKSITVVARYEDQENEGVIETTQNMPWNLLPRQNELSVRTLWSSGVNAPLPLVMVTVSLIILIWGTILYLVTFLFKIKKLR